MLEEALCLVESEREQDRRAVLLRLAMVLEGQDEIEKAKSNLREVLLIDKRLEIPDDEDREHLERLNAMAEPAEGMLAAPALAG